MMKLSNEEIKVIRDYFRDKPVARAFLFGSFSREDAAMSSDVDILVELDYTKHIGLGFLNMKFDLEDMLHKKIDLVSSNAVSNDKMMIYER
jgi:hypothetical protein